jgi:hypothetical protein
MKDLSTGPQLDVKAQIACGLYVAPEWLGADAELLAIVGSWRDTLDDVAVLSMLREYNATGRVLHRHNDRWPGDRQANGIDRVERLLGGDSSQSTV